MGEDLRLRLGEPRLRRLLLRVVGEATAVGLWWRRWRYIRGLLRVVGEATAVGVRILRVLLRLPFLAARTRAIISLASLEPFLGRPPVLRRGEVRRRDLESGVGESNLTILLMQIKKIIFFIFFYLNFITFFQITKKIILFQQKP